MGSNDQGGPGCAEDGTGYRRSPNDRAGSSLLEIAQSDTQQAADPPGRRGLQRVRLGERGPDHFHPVLGSGATKCVEIEGGELREGSKKPSIPARANVMSIRPGSSPTFWKQCARRAE
jgi:hypothetical protein